VSKKTKAKTPKAKKPAPKSVKPKKAQNKATKPVKVAKKKAAPAHRKTKTAPKKPSKKTAIKKAVASKPAKVVKAVAAPKAVAEPKQPAPPPVPALVPPPIPASVPAYTDPLKRPVNKNVGKVSIAYESPVRSATPPVRRDAPEGSGSTIKKGTAIFYDSHMHTPLCKHAWGEPEEYAAQGVRAGLKGIIFTCHCPMPGGFWPTVRMDESEFDTYVAMVKRTTDKFKGKLDVWLGLESEYYPGMEKYIEELHQRADFHFIIGSVHWQSKEYLGKFENGTIEGFRRTYFNHLADSAESGLYDCLGHPDLVKNYHPDSWCFPILKDHVAKCLDRIAATGVAMEINTSGLNKSYAEMNPGNEFLGMMAERKIPVVVGSDAHRAQRVGEHFVRALENVKAAGYKEVSYFEWRKRKTLKVDDVLANLRQHEAGKAG
jgi:HisJ family histidinol phosphate phosphatase